MELTERQREALEREGIVCVLAGAGSGKTKVLTHRYSRLLKKGVKPNQILALTFTEKAAWEMKEKILEECLKDSEIKGRIDPVEIELAPISTIHSFCSSLLKQNALELGIDPNFSIISEIESQAIAYEVVDDLLNRWRQDPEKRAKLNVVLGRLFLDISAEPTRKFREEIISVWNALRVTGDLKSILNESIKNPGYYDNFLRFSELESKDVKDLIPQQLDEDIRKRLFEIILKARSLIKKESTLKDVFENADILLEIQDFVKPFNFKGSEQRKNMLSQAATLAFKTYAWLLLDAYSIFADFLLELDEELNNKKKELGVMDFSDLEHLTYKGLKENDKLRKRIAGRYRYILIDELQDTSPIQMKILSELVALQQGKPEFFGVGDFGQSIYGFRHAEPELFKIFAQVAEGIKDEQHNRNGKIGLDRNFRSYQEILDWVKLVIDKYFETLAENKKGSEVENYKPFFQTNIIANNGYRDESEAPVEVIIITKSLKEQGEEDEASEDESFIDSDEIEANVVAKKIREIVEGNDIKYGDIAVLFRKRESMRVFKEVFERYGIPVVELTGSGFFEAAEIRDVYHILRFLDNPYDRLDLACVLSSPLLFGEDKTCGVSEDTLLKLFYEASCKGKEPFDLIIENDLPSDILESDKQKLIQLADLWNEVKDKLCAFPPDRIIVWLLKQSGYWRRAQEDDISRVYNLKKLFSLLENLRVFGGKTFYSAWHAIGEFIENEISEDMASLPIEVRDSVRFMTVHSAKGLEFRCVILANSNKEVRKSKDIELSIFPSVDLKKISTDDFLGVKNIKWEVVPLFDLRYGKDGRSKISDLKNTDINSFQTLILSRSLRNVLEELRLLYVAMTRAKEKLIISGTISSRSAPKYYTFLGMITSALKKLGFTNLTTNLPEEKLELTNESGKKLATILKIYDKSVSSLVSEPTNERYKLVSREVYTCEGENIPLITIPKTVSLAQLNKFVECPKKFYWENLAGELGRKGELKSGIEYGLVFHKAIASWANSRFQREELDPSIDMALKEFRINDDKIRAKLEDEMRKVGESEIISLAQMENAEIFCERELTLLVDNCILHGRPDLVIHEKSKRNVWVVDYKTDAINDIDEGAERYKVQALGYALALSKIFEGEDIYVLLYFTSLNQIYKSYDLKSAEELVRDALEKFIEAHRSLQFKPNPKDKCYIFCTYPKKADCIHK